MRITLIAFYTTILVLVHGPYTTHQQATQDDRIPLGEECGAKINFTRSCGTNAVCLSHQCHCPLGLVPEFNGVDCRQLRCTSDLDCQMTVNPHSVCNVPQKRCECKSTGYELDEFGITCKAQLSFGCSSGGDDCEYGAFCLDGACQCKLGYIPSRGSHSKCHLYECSHDSDCRVFSESAYCRWEMVTDEMGANHTVSMGKWNLKYRKNYKKGS